MLDDGRRIMVTIKVHSAISYYVKENLGAPFIIGFMITILHAGSLLIEGNVVLADELAIYAYYFLCAGVFLQLLSFLTSRRLKREKK